MDCRCSNSCILLRRVASLGLAIAQLLSFLQTVHGQIEDSSVFCEKFVVPYGYSCGQYATQTADGFILTAHRLSPPPRETSRAKTRRVGTTDAPSIFPPLCVATAPQPFQTIADFAGESSKTTNDKIFCQPVAPAPLTISTALEPYSTFHESGPTEAPLPQDFGDEAFGIEENRGMYKTFVKRLKQDRISTTSEEVAFRARGETVGEDGLQRRNRQWLDANAAGQSSTAPRLAPIADAPSSSSSAAGSLRAQGRPPVLLMHQEFLNGDSWFLYTDDDSDQLLPFLLLDAGFDVWIGHHRATYWSHDHATLTPDHHSFWNWTWDEHAQYDIPALLELINEKTRSTINLVGLSQSATAGAATATMPLVSPLLKSLTLIGPTMYRANTNAIALASWEFLFGTSIDSTYDASGFQNGAFNFSSEFPAESISMPSMGPMSAALSAISGTSCCLGSTVIKFNNGWDGTTSFKNLIHIQQGIRTNNWRHYDYGSPQNNSIAYFGMPFPPTYYPANIPHTLPVLVIYGGQDMTATPDGPGQFMSQLQQSPNNLAVLYPEYAHFDLSYGRNRTQDVYMTVLQFLEKQQAMETKE